MLPVLLRKPKYQKMALEYSIVTTFSTGLICICITGFQPVSRQPELFGRCLPFIFLGAVLSLIYFVMFLMEGRPGIGFLRRGETK